MPTPNPYYDPDWQEKFDFHMNEYTRLVRALFENHEEFEARQPAIQKHAKGWQDADIAQYKTVQDFARARFEAIQHASKYENLPYIEPDFESFTTIAQAQKAWSEVYGQIESIRNDRYRAMPVGRPEGRDIFEETGENKIFTSPLKICQGWPSISALAIFDVREDATHICLQHIPGQYDGTAMNYIETIANFLRQEALQNARQNSPESLMEKLGLASVFRKIDRTPQNLRPENMHFYVHVPVTAASFSRECFQEVVMQFSAKNGFHSSHFEDFDRVPQKVRDITFDNALSITPQKQGPLQLEKN